MYSSVKWSSDMKEGKRDSAHALQYRQDLCKLIQARKDGVGGVAVSFCTRT